jgi:hypothetical protein
MIRARSSSPNNVQIASGLLGSDPIFINNDTRRAISMLQASSPVGESILKATRSRRTVFAVDDSSADIRGAQKVLP